VAAPPIGSGYL